MSNLSQFTTKLNQTFNSIDMVNQLIVAISTGETSFRQNQNLSKAEEIGRQINTASGHYKISLENVKSLINIVDELIAKSNESNGSYTLSIPSAESVKDMLKSFFMGRIKTRSSPMPMNCGCYAFKVKNPKPNSFVCARYNDQFALMIVVSFVNQILKVIDPSDSENGGQNVIELTNEDWTPLPTAIPDKPISRWEHSKDSLVLSLFKQTESDDSWTMSFYTAKVLQRPCDKTPDQGERGYTLDFDNGIVQNVPEQFVVNLPDAWKSLSKETVLHV
ncbi:hypothetical protein TRFO_17536 [Tritrichomonas foetus]|uniref:SGF29 C-terminal domain-containing protein n=1 Tax=Tritrichomonas foetus TaxID=1144522 RepID=A0A1J4KRR2_9EUKA|nr:hypothetical protein TRFO_17536 [Tritrichomonas foetus]|eukprot:OHT12508.1 hypothetical protein TRFO_17536 [Tritrichomonas foetus]